MYLNVDLRRVEQPQGQHLPDKERAVLFLNTHRLFISLTVLSCSLLLVMCRA